MSRLSRDELVERGIAAERRGRATHRAWIYKAKVKVGRRATLNIEHEYYNIPHMIAEIIMRYAIPQENIALYGIQRVMRSQLRSIREDI